MRTWKSSDQQHPPPANRAMKKPKKCVRLSCVSCGREDLDGITENHLELIRPTWNEIFEVQTYEESTAVWTDEQCRYWFRSNLDWWTHLGTCPDCLDAIEVVTDEAKVNRLLF